LNLTNVEFVSWQNPAEDYGVVSTFKGEASKEEVKNTERQWRRRFCRV